MPVPPPLHRPSLRSIGVCYEKNSSAFDSHVCDLHASLLGGEPDSLKSILRQETAGSSVDRRSAVGSQPTDELSAWHAGMIRLSDGWRQVEELSSDQHNAEYEKKRAELISKNATHLRLRGGAFATICHNEHECTFSAS